MSSNTLALMRNRWTPVREAFETQCRVTRALILRETLSRYGQHKVGFLWALLEPVLMVTLFVSIMSVMRSESPGGMPIVPFMIAGIVPFSMFRNTMNQLKASISSNRSLLGFPQVSTFDLIVARALLEISVLLCVFCIMLVLAHLMGYDIRIENPLGVLACCLTLFALGCGMGFFFAAVTPIIPSVGQISGLVLGRPLLLTSGLFYTAESIPAPARDWMLYNPIIHLLELLRSAFFYEFDSKYGSWTYSISWAVGALALGMLTHQALRRRVIVGL